MRGQNADQSKEFRVFLKSIPGMLNKFQKLYGIKLSAHVVSNGKVTHVRGKKHENKIKK